MVRGELEKSGGGVEETEERERVAVVVEMAG